MFDEMSASTRIDGMHRFGQADKIQLMKHERVQARQDGTSEVSCIVDMSGGTKRQRYTTQTGLFVCPGGRFILRREGKGTEGKGDGGRRRREEKEGEGKRKEGRGGAWRVM